MPSVLDGGRQIILANWPNYKRILCTYINNIPVNIPSHPYVLLDKNILCNYYSFHLYYIKGKDMILSDFLSRQIEDDSDPHEIIPISFNIREIL